MRKFLFLFCTIFTASPVIAAEKDWRYHDFDIMGRKLTTQIEGRLYLDTGFYDGNGINRRDEYSVKSARLGVKGDLPFEGWNYRFVADFATEVAVMAEAFVRYNFSKNHYVQIGQFDEQVMLDRVGVSNDRIFMEPSSVGAFLPGQRLGIANFNYGDNWHVSAGIYGDDLNKYNADYEDISYNARFVYLPYKQDKNLVHLGLSLTHTNSDPDNELLQYSRSELVMRGLPNLSTGRISNVDSRDIIGGEFISIFGQTLIQAEYVTSAVNRSSNQDLDFAGYYAQISYVFGGTQHQYDIKEAMAKRVKITNDFSPSKGHFGALELAARYSHLDLSEGPSRDDEMSNITLGTNWYINPYTRVMVNYINGNKDQNAAGKDIDFDAVMTRLQIYF